MILNLDKNFSPLGNEKAINFQSFTFSGGEPHIKIQSDFDVNQTVTITHRLNSFNDLIFNCVYAYLVNTVYVVPDKYMFCYEYSVLLACSCCVN